MPCVLSCGHSMCNECTKLHLNGECPQCRTQLDAAPDESALLNKPLMQVLRWSCGVGEGDREGEGVQ